MEPDEKSAPPPRYVVDYEAVAQTGNPLDVIELLVDRLSRPGFNRDTQCWRCVNWDCRKGGDRPRRPYSEDPLDTCSGCVLSHLDESEEHQEREREREAAPPRPRLVRPRTLVEYYHRGRPVERSPPAGRGRV